MCKSTALFKTSTDTDYIKKIMVTKIDEQKYEIVISGNSEKIRKILFQYIKK